MGITEDMKSKINFARNHALYYLGGPAISRQATDAEIASYITVREEWTKLSNRASEMGKQLKRMEQHLIQKYMK